MIVLISGKQGSGKTTLTKELVAQGNKSSMYNATEIRFASTIYSLHDYCRVFMMSLGKHPPESAKVKDGKLLQYLGTEWGRNTYGENVWVDCTKVEVDRFIQSPIANCKPLVVVSDCRFQNEFEAFPEALRVRLECVKEVRKGRCEQWRDTDAHQSETDLDAHVYAGKFDMIIDTEFTEATEIADRIFAALQRNDWLEKRA